MNILKSLKLIKYLTCTVNIQVQLFCILKTGKTAVFNLVKYDTYSF
jgi:hypothetical protein